MITIHHLLIGVLILQIYVKAAPSDISTFEDIVKIEKEDEKQNEEPNTLLDDGKDEENDTAQGQRQKRWYNFYGLPPIAPVFPNNVKRDEVADIGGYGFEDPFSQIYRRLQDIASVARQPVLPLPPPQLPIYLPVIYIPQVGCGCTPENVPTSPQATSNGTMPDTISNRFPEMEDPRQNWGFVVNDTARDGGDEEFARPISFDPIVPNQPMNRPPPPVEHGSSQSEVNTQDQFQTTTTVRPIENLPSSSTGSDTNPSACDGAVLNCCHQLKVTYDCFVAQGCPDPTAYGNPCDTNVILRVIDKFQKFYEQRTK